MNSGGVGGGCGGGVGMVRSAFTVSQWQELEHQALIYKYLMAGVPVPPDLVLPIQKSFGSMSPRFFHHPSMGYCSLYGKKIDPEPGRCRRTDGKKWRCSKEAYPDSKYCERHMHRSRNRSRKLVESQTRGYSTITHPSSSSTGSREVAAGTSQNLPLNTCGNVTTAGSVTNQAQYRRETLPYGIPIKDYDRYVQGPKSEVVDRSFLAEPLGSNIGLQMESPLDNNAWTLFQSRVPPLAQSKSNNNTILQNEYSQHSFFAGDFTSGGNVKEEGQSLQPFFDKWPKTRGLWSGLEDETSNVTSYSTTQLSISFPMASNDFSATTSQSSRDN